MLNKPLTLLLTLWLLGSLFSVSMAREPLEKIVAVVDDNVILLSELNQEINNVAQRIQLSGRQLPDRNVLLKQVLEHMIVREIQLAQAKQRGIKVDDTLLNDQILRIAQGQNMTLSQLKQAIEQDGMSYLDYREGLRQEIVTQQLKQRLVYDRIFISDQEIDDFLAQNPVGQEQLEYNLKHILIGIPEAASAEDIAEAESKAKEVFEQLQAGANFEELATSVSDGQRALEGGNLGWLPKNQLPTIFIKAIEKVAKGDVAQPTRSPSGFHILNLVDIRGDQRQMVQQNRSRHILITPDAITTEDQAYDKIKAVKQRIDQGEDFAELAKSFSADGSAAEGGNLGWASPGQYVPSFQKVVDSIPLNKVSEPVKTQFGWHLIEVLERKEQDQTDEFRRNLARRSLHEQKASEEEELWFRRIRDQAFVDIRL